MSHAEIWDDSALIESWDAAVEEYKHYHSIHARGERVEDVLRAYGNVEEITASGGIAKNDKEINVYDGMIEQDEEPVATISQTQETHTKTTPSSRDTKSTPVVPPLPPHLFGPIHDEGIKNLLMSWYYAGYYTGLYEGQQSAKTEQNGTSQ